MSIEETIAYIGIFLGVPTVIGVIVLIVSVLIKDNK
jgi:hypothetical protein